MALRSIEMDVHKSQKAGLGFTSNEFHLRSDSQVSMGLTRRLIRYILASCWVVPVTCIPYIINKSLFSMIVKSKKSDILQSVEIA